MIIINTVDEKYFTLDGVQFARIYQPLAQGSEAIGLYNKFDTKQQLQNSTAFGEFNVDGVIYVTQAETIAALLDVIYSSISEFDFEQLEQRVTNSEQAIEDLQENQVTGVQVYSNYQDRSDGRSFLPVTGVLLVSYKVADDAVDSLLNGFYHWSGSSYIKDDDDTAQKSGDNTFTSNNNFEGDVVVPLSVDPTHAARVNEVNNAQSTADTAEAIAQLGIANAAAAQTKADMNEGDINAIEIEYAEKSIGVNIINPDAITELKQINVLGEIVDAVSAFAVTGLMPVNGKDIYIDDAFVSSIIGHNVLNKKQEVLRTILNTKQYTYVSGDYYLQATVNFTKAGVTYMLAHHGNAEIETREPYTVNLVNETLVSDLEKLKVDKKYTVNLLNQNDADTQIGKNYILSGGDPTVSTGFSCISGKIPCVVGDIFGENVDNTPTNILDWVLFDKNDNIIDYGQNRTYEVTLENASYLKKSIYCFGTDGYVGGSVIGFPSNAMISKLASDDINLMPSEFVPFYFNSDLPIMVDSYNVNHKHMLNSGYRTEQESRDVVPANIRKLGLEITYKKAEFQKIRFIITSGCVTSGDIGIILDSGAFTRTTLDSAVHTTPELVAEAVAATPYVDWTIDYTSGNDYIDYTYQIAGQVRQCGFYALSTGITSQMNILNYGKKESWNTDRFIGESLTEWGDPAKWNTISNSNKQCLCAGDSLVQGSSGGVNPYTDSFPAKLQDLITADGHDIEVFNTGQGGEQISAIAARQGSMLYELSEDVTIPADIDTEVTITDPRCTYGGYYDNPLGADIGYTFQNILTSYANIVNIGGVDGYLRILSSKTYSFRRKEAGDARTLYEGEIIQCYHSEFFNDPYISCYWIGSNGSYDSTADLVEQTRQVANYYKNSFYVIIGMHYVLDTNTKTEFLATLPDRIEQEAALKKEFGLNYIDWRKYVVNHGISDAIDLGLLPDDGTYPTAADDTAISEGKMPPSLMKDTAHPNEIGYELVARQVFNRLKMLGAF